MLLKTLKNNPLNSMFQVAIYLTIYSKISIMQIGILEATK